MENTQDLEALKAKALGMSDKDMVVQEMSVTYISLCQSGAKALKENNKDYMPDLKQGDYYIHKDKKIFGKELKVVPIAFTSVYNEMEDVSNNAKFFGLWTEKDAANAPFKGDSFYIKELPNGHVLFPVKWVVLKLIDYPEFDYVVLTLKNTATKLFNAWVKEVNRIADNEGVPMPMQIYTLSRAMVENDKGSWYQPSFEYAGTVSNNQAVPLLEQSNDLREQILGDRFFPTHSMNTVSAYIDDGEDTYSTPVGNIPENNQKIVF